MNITRFIWFFFLTIFNYINFYAVYTSDVVTYYLKPGFAGTSTSLRMERGICYDLIDHYNNDRMQSIQPGKSCVELFVAANCRRRFLRVAPGTICHMDLSNCKLNNAISSLKLC